jgi:tripartite ATP-independent transporter DctP family solute receptor
MLSRKRFLLAAAALFVLTAAPAIAQRKTVINLGHVFAPNHTMHEASLKFAQLVDQKTRGQVEVRIHPSSTLGHERECIEGMQLGTVDMSLVSAGVVGNFEPKVGILDLPYIFRDINHVHKVVDGEIGKELNQALQQKVGMRVLAWGDTVFRYVFTKRTPITKIEDFRGLKIRTPEAWLYAETFRLLGANPTPIAWGELYTALQTGVVEGLENAPEAVYTARLHEQVKHAIRTEHIFVAILVSVSERVYSRLPAEVHKALTEAAQEAWAWQRQVADANNVLFQKKLADEGMTFHSIDKNVLQNRVRPMYEEYGKKSGTLDLINRLISVR